MIIIVTVDEQKGTPKGVSLRLSLPLLVSWELPVGKLCLIKYVL